MEVLEEAAVPGVGDQDPVELVRGGARQRERRSLVERRSIRTTCEPPHVASARRRAPPRSFPRLFHRQLFHPPALVLQTSSA